MIHSGVAYSTSWILSDDGIGDFHRSNVPNILSHSFLIQFNLIDLSWFKADACTVCTVCMDKQQEIEMIQM